MIEHEDVLIATAGGDGEFASLVRLGFQDFLVRKEHAADVMGFGSGQRCGQIIGVGGRGNVTVHILLIRLQDGRFCGTEVLGLLILVTKNCGNAGRKVFGNEVGRKAGESGEVTAANGS